jgi:hypothetical protein
MAARICELVASLTLPGNAEIAHHAGVGWSLSPELQAITCHFRLGNVAPGFTWQQLETACQQAMAGSAMRYGGPWLIRLNDHEVSINATRVVGNPIDPAERTALEQSAREDMLAISARLREHVPALRESYLLSGATDLHVPKAARSKASTL